MGISPFYTEFTTINLSLKIAESGTALIRFEKGRDSWLWVQPESILFIKSSDHYVKTLVQYGDQKKWTLRHSTMKDLLPLLNDRPFIRLNRFYILNRSHFSHVDQKAKKLFFKDGFSIIVSYSISPFVLTGLHQSIRELGLAKNFIKDFF
jgi:DNA-binding LytR/AlgR family response regulator